MRGQCGVKFVIGPRTLLKVVGASLISIGVLRCDWFCSNGRSNAYNTVGSG